MQIEELASHLVSFLSFASGFLATNNNNTKSEAKCGKDSPLSYQAKVKIIALLRS